MATILSAFVTVYDTHADPPPKLHVGPGNASPELRARPLATDDIKRTADDPAQDPNELRRQRLKNLKPGATLILMPDGSLEVAGPGGDLGGYWKRNAKFEPMRTMAKDTGGLVTVGSPSQMFPIVDMFLDRVTPAHFSQSQPDVAKTDIVIAIDTTGSMAATWDQLVVTLEKLSDTLKEKSKQGHSIRVSLIGYKDDGDLYTAKVLHDFTFNVKHLAAEAKKSNVSGGKGDIAAVYDGVDLSQNGAIKWRPEARKTLIVIGDAPPQPRTTDNKQEGSDLIKTLKKNGVSVYPIIINSR